MENETNAEHVKRIRLHYIDWLIVFMDKAMLLSLRNSKRLRVSQNDAIDGDGI